MKARSYRRLLLLLKESLQRANQIELSAVIIFHSPNVHVTNLTPTLITDQTFY